MTPERMFQELLGLGLNWEVVESRFDHQTSTVVLEIRETVRLSFIMGGLNGISSGLGAYFGFDFEKNDICSKSKMITK